MRAKFVESHINKGLAFQLRAMRESREWSQEQLAVQVGMPQTAISRLESANYGKQTITTLKRMAKVYDVALEVRFVPFSKLLNRISGTSYVEHGLSSEAMDVPSFEEEVECGAFQDRDSTPIPRMQNPIINTRPLGLLYHCPNADRGVLKSIPSNVDYNVSIIRKYYAAHLATGNESQFGINYSFGLPLGVLMKRLSKSELSYFQAPAQQMREGMHS